MTTSTPMALVPTTFAQTTPDATSIPDPISTTPPATVKPSTTIAAQTKTPGRMTTLASDDSSSEDDSSMTLATATIRRWQHHRRHSRHDNHRKNSPNQSNCQGPPMTLLRPTVYPQWPGPGAMLQDENEDNEGPCSRHRHVTIE